MHDDSPSPVSRERRQEVFLALVQAQDGGESVRESRSSVARKFGISAEEVRRIEREGIQAG